MMLDEPLESERPRLSANWAVREVDHLFGRFARYTKFVLVSKWFLAIFAGALLVVLIVVPMLEKRTGARLSFVSEDETAVADGTPAAPPSMARPVYEGTDASGRAYRITGGKATQISTEMIEVSNVEGMLENGDESFVSLTADKAQYYQAEGRIELVGNVHMLHSEGYDFATPSASVDTRTMHVTGKEQINGEGPMGKLLATGFEIKDNGRIIQFGDGTSRVDVTIDKARQ